MVSSKFSRRPIVQQPPPVCRSKPKPIVIIPPPPHNTLWIHATWAGECTDGIYRELDEVIRYNETFPQDPPTSQYEATRADERPFFSTNIFHPDSEPYQLWFGWQGATWNAAAWAFLDLPGGPPVDIGPNNADLTGPRDRTATFHIYTTYTPPE